MEDAPRRREGPVGRGAFDGALAGIAARRDGVDERVREAGFAFHDELTKPPRSLGRLETLGVQLAVIAGEVPPPLPEPAAVAVFAADHGVVDDGVSAWPSEVTAQMVANFAAGGAAVNALARQMGAEVVAVDVGIASDPAEAPGLLRRKVRRGTRNLRIEDALTPDETRAALDAGAVVASDLVGRGFRCLVTGDMGIGNTTACSALIASLTGTPPTDVVDRGAGSDDRTVERKIEVVAEALDRVAGRDEPLDLVAALGGLEIAALMGFIAGGVEARVPVIVDGIVGQTALLAVVRVEPRIVDGVVVAHRSRERGSSAALAAVGVEPVLDLDLALGEGSGALLALPIVQGAARVMRDMATFDAAGVTDKR